MTVEKLGDLASFGKKNMHMDWLKLNVQNIINLGGEMYIFEIQGGKMLPPLRFKWGKVLLTLKTNLCPTF